jgi:putative hydrolase of the HAD superfamily
VTAPAGVIFDYGGVLLNMRWDVSRQLEDAHDLPRGAIIESLYRTPTWRGIERGRGDRAAWIEEAHALLEAKAGRALPRLHETWRESQHAIEPNVALARGLRPAYRTAILSNADASLRGRLRETGLHDLFDTIVSSAEEGLAKPEAAIYELAAARLGLSPSACVFIDDYDANVEAAEAVGMRGIVFRVDKGDDLQSMLLRVGVAAS